MGESQLFRDFLIVIGSATVVVTMLQLLRVPGIVSFLGAGLLIGPHGLGLVTTAPQAEVLIELGAVFLMFTIGLEFSLAKLSTIKRAFFGLGLNQVLCTILIVACLVIVVFDLSWQKSVVLGFLAAVSSTATVLKLMEDNRDTAAPYSQMTIGVLLFQDIAIIPMILSLPLITNGDEITSLLGISYMGALKTLGIVCGFLLMIVLGRIYIVPFVIARVAKTKNRELFFFCILFFCLGTAFAMEEAGLSLSIGAFFAGLMISGSLYGKQVLSDITPIRDNLLSFFFLSVGMLLDLSFVFDNLFVVIALLLALIFIKVTLIWALALIFGYSRSLALMCSLSLFQMGEFSLILAGSAVNAGILSATEMQFFLSVSVLSLSITPLVYQWAPRICEIVLGGKKSQISLDLKTKNSGNHHTLIIGYGVAGENVGSSLSSLGINYSVIDINPDNIKNNKDNLGKFYYGDASSLHILEEAGLEKANLVVITISATKMIGPIVRKIKSVHPEIPIIVRTQFLAEIKKLKVHDVDLVVSEFESSIQILGRVLTYYGVSDTNIRGAIQSSRGKFNNSYHPSSLVK